jgi:hypothetical protein
MSTQRAAEASGRRFVRVLCFQFLGPVLLGCSLFASAASEEAPAPGGTDRTVEPNAPETYPFADRCMFFPLISIEMEQVSGLPGQPPNLIPVTRFAMLTVCLTGATVQEDRRMKFEVEYSLAPMEEETSEVRRESDQDNRNVFLTDDAGGRYEFLEAGGCAGEELRTQGEERRCSGWFLFPPADPGAEVFAFHYAPADSTEPSGADVIDGIVLPDAE